MVAEDVKFEKLPFWKKYLLFWGPGGAENLHDWLDDWEIEPVAVMPIAFLLLVWLATILDPDAIAGTFAMVVALSPVWLPIYLFVFFWSSWIHYIRLLFWFDQKHILLHIELPPEVSKSPLAMELFLSAIYQTGGEGDFVSRIWKGKVRPHWALELVGNEGRVDYYLYMREGWRNVLEAKLYGQFPEAKVTLADDYVDRVSFDPDTYGMWGTEYKKTEIALPIRTYIDYGLDKNTDTPEIQVDPITSILEHMSTMGPDEYLWLQFVIRGHKKDEWHGFYLEKDPYDVGVKKKLKEITEAAVKRAQDLVTGDEAEKKKVGSRGSTLLSPGEREQVEAIEHSKSKSLFDVGIRGLYIAKMDKFKGINTPNVVTMFNAFRYPGYASFSPTRGQSIFTYAWQDWNNIRQNKIKKNLFFQYKHRAYFAAPYDQTPSYMTTEELATLWHFPNSMVKTPGLSRVPSRRSEAPPNLPVGPANLPAGKAGLPQ